MKKNHTKYFIFRPSGETRGFTLVELLIVMVIIGVLAGLSLFALSGARESARNARRKADLETIRSGLEIYKADCDTYADPGTYGNITSGSVLGASLTGGDGTCPGNSNTYIEEIPNDTLSGQYYRYWTDGVAYEICASLEDETGSVTCGGSNVCGSGITCNYQVTNP